MMSGLIIAIFTLAGVGLASPNKPGDKKDDAVVRDQKSLQGSWKLISVETEGQKVPPEQLKVTRLIFTSDKLTIQEGDKVRETYTFLLAPEKNPKGIDMKAISGPRKGQTILGIYDVVGNVLRLCDSKSNRHRPESFETRPDSDFIAISIVLHRDKP
ncbi:MAG: TIGR03067 domain-containing protein [Gemmataceae bacterium]|nr:TIGR03067 domain-containing protein [Gemmataceae bacterium]